MTTYTYVCRDEKCSKTKDVVHGMIEEPDVFCDCGTSMYRAVVNNNQAKLCEGMYAYSDGVPRY